MKTLKEDVWSRIVMAARSEFIKCGYRKTSMRTISAKSGVVLGNIYNYFKTKDDIFCTVLRPLLSVIGERMAVYSKGEHEEKHLDFSRQRQKDFLSSMLRIIFLYKEELRLLLFESQGTSLENFREAFIDEQVAISRAYMKQVETSVSPLFFRISASTWLTIIGEIVSRPDLQQEEVRQALTEYIRYNTAGWQELIKQ